VTITGCPSSASRAARWLNGISASLGMSPQMLSSSGAVGNSGVVSPQLGHSWPLMFSTPATTAVRGFRCAMSLRAS
jgi:hypothetical protein